MREGRRERGRGREAGCFIGCDLKQDGDSLRGIKQQEEEQDAEAGSDVIRIFKMTERTKSGD